MTNQKNDYKILIERLAKALEQTPNELAKLYALTENYIKAAAEMTKDEMALIQAYLKRDMQTFTEHYQQAQQDKVQSDAFRQVIADSLWEKLAEITDQTQLEWREVFADIKHQGIYHAGEIVGLGILKCEQCGHKTEHYHVDVLMPCTQCGSSEFSREQFKV